MRSRYDLMTEFETLNEDGNTYKDIFSYPNDENITSNFTPKELIITQREKQRIDLTMFEIYDLPEMEDVIQWHNFFVNTYAMQNGDILSIPDGRDMMDFYTANEK